MTTISYWPLGKLVPYTRNPRKNDHAVSRMVGAIREFGFKIPILARTSGEVVDDHLRLKAAQKLGLSEIPVILCDEWTDAQVKAFRLMVNRSVTWADWDTELVALEIQELKALDFDLSLTGFDPMEIDEFLFADDQTQTEEQIPELPTSPVSRLGHQWNCGEHRILCGDASGSGVAQRSGAGTDGDGSSVWCRVRSPVARASWPGPPTTGGPDSKRPSGGLE